MIINGRQIREKMKRGDQDVHKGQIPRNGGVGMGVRRRCRGVAILK